MKEKLKDFKESNGFLTKEGKLFNRTEVHSFVIGIYHGLTPTRGIPQPVLEENQDVRREPHYAKGGYILGRTVFTAGAALTGGMLI
jgi:hypothetical protein